MIHPLSDVQSKNIGENTNVWQFVVILPQAIIGNNCNICSHCFIENDVVIGNNVTVKCGVYIWDGVSLEDNVFIGPCVTFTNDLYPRSKKFLEKIASTLIKKGASIGANCTIKPGVIIGEYAFVGAGSVVTKDIAAYQFWYGVPAMHKGYVTRDGVLVDLDLKDKEGNMYVLVENEPIRK
jgi:acetyltransferase-like isoleucine patch superfamily enzyme